MFPPVDTKDPTAVSAEAAAAFSAMFPSADRGFVPRAFGWAQECFTGRYGDYQAIDACYHDFEHTLQGTLCMVRLLRGRHRAGATPLLPQRLFELGLVAILFHDTGYLKVRSDRTGTGAKYTAVHVHRSAEFAAAFLAGQGFGAGEIGAVQHMIRCTGVNVDLPAIPFQSDLERMVGYGLGTADYLGQMAAADYVEKLPILYSEFAEAARFNEGKALPSLAFTTAEDLMRKTPGFWTHFVLPKLTKDFGGLYRFLADPYPDGPTEYLERVEANIQRLRRQFPA